MKVEPGSLGNYFAIRFVLFFQKGLVKAALISISTIIEGIIVLSILKCKRL